ncbi:conserved Hypothetical protein [Herminiimonas arsenicoxydans]|uniref:Uncharacterized protein n=1 Tax=Herminiimonas arsenicoxydans TaxID=204773 RepID=A4G585_HERAR|nr:conserved Hypothetical protein [Herminiimonas arsenicoxydans]
MTIYGLLQDVIIGAVVLVSALYVLRKLLPKWVRGRQLALATALNQPSRAVLLRKLGGFLQPGISSGGGCGSGCSSCSSCASNPEVQAEAGKEIKPLEFQRHI